MKMTMNHASLFSAVCIAVCALGTAHAATTQADCTAYMTDSDTSQNNSSFNHGAHWSDGNIPGEGSTNYVGTGYTLRDSYVSGGTLSYPGDVLVLAGTFTGMSSGGATISWPELRLENGALYTWSSFSRIAGKVVVEADATAPAVLRMFYPGNYNGTTLEASFSGGPDSCLMLARNSGTPLVPLPDLRWSLAGDWSQFYGTCIVSNRSQFVPARSNAVYPGTVIVEEGGYWWSYYNFGSAVTTVGTLDLRDGSHFWGRCNSSGSTALTVVTDELKIGAVDFAFWDTWASSGKSASVLPNYTVGGNPVKIPIFKLTGAAAGKVPDLTKATIPDYPASKKVGEFPRLKALVCEDNGDGTKTISAKYYDDGDIIIMRTANGSYQYAQSAFNPDNGSYWSTGEVPTSETSGDAYAGLPITWTGYNTYSYPNLTYTIASALYMQCDSLTAKRFIFTNGGSISTYSQGKYKNMYGPITLAKAGVTNSIDVFQNFILTIHGDISGPGSLKIINPSPHANPVGHTIFKGSHAGLHGAFIVFCNSNSDTSTGKSLMPDVANGKYTNVSIERGDQFGGEYIGNNPWQSIWVNCYGCLHMTNADVTVSEPTRGLFVDGGTQLDVGDGLTCTLDIPVTFGGELLKRGNGKLSLGGEARFIDGDPATEPLEGTNRLTLVAGSLEVTSTNAVNGVRVAFGEGTSLVVDPEPADADLADVGILNTRWSEPFVSTRADGRIPVTFKASSPTLESGVGSYSVALCTVPASAADGVRAMLKMPNVPHYRVTVEPRANADGSVTLLAAFMRKGFVLSFR